MNISKLKSIGFAALIMLTLAWSGIVKNVYVVLALGFFGASALTIYLFVMNETLTETRSLTKYMLRLLGISILSAFPYFMIFRDLTAKFSFGDYLSFPFTIFFCVGVITVLDKIKSQGIRIFVFIIMCVFAMFIKVEFAPFTLILAYMIHFYEDKPRYRNFNIIMFFSCVFICAVLFYVLKTGFKTTELMQTATLLGVILPLPLLKNYDGEFCKNETKAKKAIFKWSGYASYLLLVVVLALIKYYLVK